MVVVELGVERRSNRSCNRRIIEVAVNFKPAAVAVDKLRLIFTLRAKLSGAV